MMSPLSGDMRAWTVRKPSKTVFLSTGFPQAVRESSNEGSAASSVGSPSAELAFSPFADDHTFGNNTPGRVHTSKSTEWQEG